MQCDVNLGLIIIAVCYHRHPLSKFEKKLPYIQYHNDIVYIGWTKCFKFRWGVPLFVTCIDMYMYV